MNTYTVDYLVYEKDSTFVLTEGVMQIQARLFDLVAVVGYEKPSEIVGGTSYLESRALDPLWQRPFNANPLADDERRYDCMQFQKTGSTTGQAAESR